MHESLINELKVHVDSLQPEEEEDLKLVGWCGSREFLIKDVRLFSDLGGVGKTIFGKKRPDVASHYESDDFLNSGFEILFDPHKVKGKTKIQAFIHDWTDILELGELEQDSVRSTPSHEIEHTDIEDEVCSVPKIKKNLAPNLIVVDNFYQNPNEVRDFALRQDFFEHKDYHKGQRTEEKFLPEGIKKEFESLLGKKISRWDYGLNGIFQFCTSEDQLVYHIDGQDYAALIYLTPNAPPECGTSLFKSRINNLRGVPTQEDSEKLNKTERELFDEIFKTGFYDKTNLELTDKIGNVYNRLILMNAKLVHAASEYFGNNKTNSRLFQLFFFDIEK